MAKNQALITLNQSTWVQLTDSGDANLTFQVVSVEFASAKVLLRTAATTPSESVGWSYGYREGEVGEPLTSFGTGGLVWAKTTIGAALVQVTSTA